jgi:cupin 2 domain-containing protein
VSRNQKTEEDGKAEMKKNRVNLFQDLPGHLDQELVETLQAHDSFRIERIVSRGHISPREFWYDQEEHEWVTVLTGKAQLQIEGEEALVTLCPGDTYDLINLRRLLEISQTHLRRSIRNQNQPVHLFLTIV